MTRPRLSQRTRPHRLAALDAWVLQECGPLVRDAQQVIDFGYGEAPVTTEELAVAVRSLNPASRVIGVDRASRTTAVTGVELRAGDFATCASLGPTSLVRAMNVLRSYGEGEVDALHRALAAPLVDGGLLIEGSTDTQGQVLTAWLLRKRGADLHREALLFHTDFSRGFSPWLFRDWLPRDLRRGVRAGTAIYALLDEWEGRARATDARAPHDRFLGSLAPPLVASTWERAHGFVRWPAHSRPPAAQ